MRRIVVAVAVLIGFGVLALSGAVLWAYLDLRGSLPALDGTVALAGLEAPVVVERDSLGVPTIRGANREDVARVTGFLHAQERFFQMDLQRRSAAGELAEIFGAPALPADREIRVHRFRARARDAFESLPATDRTVLEAYAAGVNAGLGALRRAPFEYRLLGVQPEPWLPEDTGLTVLAMFRVLQDPSGSRESALGVMHDTLPEPLFAFLAPGSTLWDAPVEGSPLPVPPIPSADVFDLRKPGAVIESADARRAGASAELAAGSNDWAVSGSLTENGGAILADDMHLPLSVPNIWYRASFEIGSGEDRRRVTGITLPGTPIMIVGSNGHVAWGFTNTMGDWGDLVVLEPAPDDPDAYLTPDGPRTPTRFAETLHVKDGDDEELAVVETIWGPVVDTDHRGRRRAYRWVAHDRRAENLEMLRLESAADVDEAIEIAARAGIPAQNFVVAGRDGRIAWTVAGAIPARFGHDGRLPSSWADGRRGWDGWLPPDAYPRIVDPPGGRIWTANNRVVGGAKLQKIGFGAFLDGARARQIRDDLRASDRMGERDLLAIELDHRALFLAPWRDLLLEVLSDSALRADPRRVALRDRVRDWGGSADVDSVGYRVVREFRDAVWPRALSPLVGSCVAVDPQFDYEESGNQQEGPLWRLVTERPAHLLDPRFASWEALLLDAADQVLADATANGADLDDYTWGAWNRVPIRHPLSPFLPAPLSRWLDMPANPLPGDAHMPLHQTREFAVSERMIVSPGHEDEGIFHMPTGQSGHPLSPFYRNGHEAWVDGDPTPFLPGAAEHVLRFEPAGGSQ